MVTVKGGRCACGVAVAWSVERCSRFLLQERRWIFVCGTFSPLKVFTVTVSQSVPSKDQSHKESKKRLIVRSNLPDVHD